MTKVICIETGEVFDNARDAAVFARVIPRNILDAARGTTLSSGGYHWKYADDETQYFDQAKPRSRPNMTIYEVQEEARRRTEETGCFTRYADIQKEETLRMIAERDKKRAKND